MSDSENGENAPRKRGRPLSPFDPELFEKLCALHCTQKEIAGIQKMAPDILCIKVEDFYQMSYREAFDQFSAPGKLNLRRKQLEVGLKKGDTRMLIHLGEQYLGQTPKREIFGELRPIELKYSLDDKEEKPTEE